MDAWDYSLNFSSEMLVAGFVVVIAVLNVIGFNPFKKEYTHQDKSLASHLLRYHSGLNSQLASKQNTISTTVASKNGFISKAFADNELGEMVLGATTTESSSEDGIEDSGIEKANMDSIQKLVSRQVQIYETKPFDTVYTVSKQFGVSDDSIMETNGLPDHALKAGWFLVIPPVENGIVVQVTNPEISVTDLAEKYRANIDLIVSYNGLEGPDAEIADGDYIVIPDGRLPEPPKPTPSSSTNSTTRRISVPVASFKGTNKFAKGQCTDYAARMTGWVNWRGNANMWATNAKKAGHTVDKNPTVGAIIQTNESRWGHVGYIESVNGNQVTFSEWNYAGPFKKTTRTLSITDSRVKAIIHN